ncbi:group II intron reverse transcriptase/maturase [compost metagenome]
MPVTHSGLYDQVVAFDSLLAASREASRGKRYTSQGAAFAARREEELINLHNHLVYGTWQPSPPREFVVREPKLRLIQAPIFADRVVHHAVYRVVNPLFERKFIADSFACRAGKGHLAAAQRVQQQVRQAKRNWGRVWVLKADISRFFASIDHDVVLAEFARTVADPRLCDLVGRIVRNSGAEGAGLPVGALTSQLLANVLLNRLDHYAKDTLGYRYYCRYMDDFVVLLPDKASAREALRLLGEQVNALGLSLNPKTAVHPAQRGIDFCGYRIWATHMLPRKRNIKRARRQFRRLAERYAQGRTGLEDIQPRVASFLAYTKHCQARETVEGVLRDLRLSRRSY